MARIKIHPSNFVYLAICLFGISAFFFVAIFPNLGGLETMDEEISALNEKVERQTFLYPVYVKLLKEVTQTIPTKLPTPVETAINHDDLSNIDEYFNRIASESHVNFLSAIPDASNYLEDTGDFSMSVSFSGDFFNLHDLLLSICQIPFLESIDMMRIETIDQEKRINFKIRLKQE